MKEWKKPWHNILMELFEKLDTLAEENKVYHQKIEESGKKINFANALPYAFTGIENLQNQLSMSFFKEAHRKRGMDIWSDESNDNWYRFGAKRHQVFLASTVVVQNKNTGKYLLIERGHEPFAGYMAFPGGFVDEGEDAVHAAQRELKEETNVEKDIKDFVYVDLRSNPNRDPRGHIVDTGWFVQVDSEEILAGDDAKNVGWYTTEEIDSFIANDNFGFDLKELWSKIKK